MARPSWGASAGGLDDHLADDSQALVSMGPLEEMHFISQPSARHHINSQLKQRLRETILTLLHVTPSSHSHTHTPRLRLLFLHAGHNPFNRFPVPPVGCDPQFEKLGPRPTSSLCVSDTDTGCRGRVHGPGVHGALGSNLKYPCSSIRSSLILNQNSWLMSYFVQVRAILQIRKLRPWEGKRFTQNHRNSRIGNPPDKPLGPQKARLWL